MTDPSVLDKEALIGALRMRVESQLGRLTRSQHASQAGAAHEEARAEHPKDTRATEASYLARGLAERVAQLQRAAARLAEFHAAAFAETDAIALGALVGVEDDHGRESVHFLVPAAGGEKIEVGEQVVHAVTPDSPLGREIVGRERDEDFELDLPGGRVGQTVVWVR